MYVTRHEISTVMAMGSECPTIVAANKSVTPVADCASLGDFFATLEGNVHVAIDRLQVT